MISIYNKIYFSTSVYYNPQPLASVGGESWVVPIHKEIADKTSFKPSGTYQPSNLRSRCSFYTRNGNLERKTEHIGHKNHITL